MSVGNRIRSLRRTLKLSQPELAKKSGVGQSTISDLENDKKSTSAENMLSIANALGVSTGFLLTGDDYKSSKNDGLQEIQKQVSDSDQGLSDFELNQIQIRYFDDFPVSCGSGTFGEILEKDAKKLTINLQPLVERRISTKDCIALPATGDSMYPTIKDKDIVYVDLSRATIKDGKIFAICHGGLFKFKRLYQLPLGGVRIASDNSAEYPEERLTAQEMVDQQFEIIGWAWSWQSMENW